MKIICKYVSYEDFQASRMFMGKKVLALMKHENKDGAKTSLPISNYIVYVEDNVEYYLIRSNVFMRLADQMLFKANERFPDYFGTGNASDVIDGLQKYYPYGAL